MNTSASSKSGSHHWTQLPPEANDPNSPGNIFPSDKFIFRRFVMKRIRILVLILCACFVSVAWSQQPAANAIGASSSDATNMGAEPV